MSELAHKDYILKNYRIKQVIYPNGDVKYYPQVRFLGLFWIGFWNGEYESGEFGYNEYSLANEKIILHSTKKSVSYLQPKID
jgi:hypothetical protein